MGAWALSGQSECGLSVWAGGNIGHGAHVFQAEFYGLSFQRRPALQVKTFGPEGDAVMAGEHRQLRVVGISKEAFVAGWGSVPSKSEPGMTSPRTIRDLRQDEHEGAGQPEERARPARAS